MAIPKTDGERWRKAIVALSIAVYAVFVAIMASLPRAGLLAHTAADDSFYYLEIAQRFGGPKWPTFDGVHVTTGFHPLWELILAIVARPFEPHSIAFVRVAVVLSSICMLGAVLVAARLARLWLGADAAAMTVVLLAGSMGLARFGLMAMEAPLSLLLALSLLLELERALPRWILVGVLAGLTILARLDMVMLVGLALAYHAFRRGKLKSVVVSSAVCGAILAPYFAWNVWLTGHLATTSSATKEYVVSHAATASYGGRLSLGYVRECGGALVRAAGQVGRNVIGGIPAAIVGTAGDDYPSAVAHRPSWIALGVVTLLIALAAWGLARKLSPASPSSVEGATFMRVLVPAACLHVIASSFILPGQSGEWYFGLESLAAAFGLVRLASSSPLRLRAGWMLASANLVAFVAVVLVTVHARTKGAFDERVSFSGAMAQMSDTLTHEVPAGGVVGSNNAGTLGYLSERTVTNMDGLANDFSLLEARRAGDVRGWMRRNGVTWFADCVPVNRQDSYAKALGIRPGEITVVDRKNGGACEAFLWKLDVAAD